MDNILGLNKKNALDMMFDLSDVLFTNYNILCDFEDELSISTAKTYRNDDGYAISVNIGTCEISKAKRLFPYVKQPVIFDEDFVNVIINMYHEQMHCIQKNQLFRNVNSDEHVIAQAIQEIACIDNPDYYVGDGNYFINANEIQAEEYGILKGYQYLLKAFPDIDSNQLETIVLNVVNNKMQTSSYFVNQSEPFTSLSEVEDAFDEAYAASFETKRRYFVKARSTNDVVKKFMQENPEAEDVYLSISNPLEQDKCVAAINLRLHPGWSDTYTVLHTTDLSYETIIEKPYQAKHNKLSRTEMVESEFPDLFEDSDNKDYELE